MDLTASAMIIRDALGIKTVMIRSDLRVTTLSPIDQRELSVSLFFFPPFRGPSGHSHVSGAVQGLSSQPTLDDLLAALDAAMSSAAESECKCCSYTKTWPSFDELAAQLTEYHHGF